MAQITIYLPNDLAEDVRDARRAGGLNASVVCQEALRTEIIRRQASPTSPDPAVAPIDTLAATKALEAAAKAFYALVRSVGAHAHKPYERLPVWAQINMQACATVVINAYATTEED